MPGSAAPRLRALRADPTATTRTPSDDASPADAFKLQSGGLDFIPQQRPDFLEQFREGGIGPRLQERSWSLERHVDDRLDPSWLGGEDEHPVRHDECLVDRVGDEDDRVARLLPDTQQL